MARLKYVAEVVEDGRAAVERCREAMEAGHGFDAVILDLTVPGGMGGKETIERPAEVDPGVRAFVSSATRTIR